VLSGSGDVRCEANTDGVHTSVQADVLDVVVGSVRERYRCGGIVFWVRIRVVGVLGGDNFLVEVEAESREGTEIAWQLCHVVGEGTIVFHRIFGLPWGD